MSENSHNNNASKTGSVMVIGAGIAGMQAALDLADSEFKVYLVDESPSIGGRMAQLDKTFPTNDCSMCMISPKLIEVGKHFNIEIVPNARAERIDGEPGHLKVDVLKKARYVDTGRCTACGLCAQTDDLGPDVLRMINGQIWADRIRIDERKCIHCGDCADACLAENPERQGITNVVLQRQKMVEEQPLEKMPHETLANELARMSLQERGEFWRKQLNKCIKCYGCREVCPICLCEYCELENPNFIPPGRLASDDPLFHLIRAYHIADKCINCGACEDTCPVGIPLMELINAVRRDGTRIFEYIPSPDEEMKKKVVEELKEYPISERKARL